MELWIGFIICTAVIVYSGTKLSKYGDIIAEKTGLGRAWVGLVLMASVTSLPELITGISSVSFANVPDIAVGDVLGSFWHTSIRYCYYQSLYGKNHNTLWMDRTLQHNIYCWCFYRPKKICRTSPGTYRYPILHRQPNL